MSNIIEMDRALRHPGPGKPRVFSLITIPPVPDRGTPLMSGTEGARLHTGHLGHRTLHHHCVHHPLLPSQACRIIPYRAHHSFKLHLQPEWTHRQPRAPVPRPPLATLSWISVWWVGSSPSLCSPMPRCSTLASRASPPHQAEEGAPLVHGSHLWHHPLLLHDTGDSGVLVVQRGYQ